MTRRVLQTLLGVLWVVDGLLQLKPQMFTQAFVKQVILPGAQSQPAWVSNSITWAANVIGPHIALFNGVFAGIQLLIGLALILNFRTKAALVVSFVWTLLVWWFGEGFGQLMTGQALTLTGAPGAVLLYGLIGWAIWPRAKSDRDSEPIRPSGAQFARVSLGILWIFGAFLEFQPAYLSAKGLQGVISADWFANLVGTNGVAFSVGLGILQLLTGIGVLSARNRRPFMWLSMLMSILFWWVGQSFGQMISPLGTDPNTGPLFILLTLCASPRLLSGTREIDTVSS